MCLEYFIPILGADLGRDQGGSGLLLGLTITACTASEISLTADFLDALCSIAILSFIKHQIYVDSISEHEILSHVPDPLRGS